VVTNKEISALYRKWGPFVYRRCLRMLSDPAEAEDGVQEVFLRFLKNADRYADDGRTLNFLYRISTNWCLNRIRSRKVRGDPIAPDDSARTPDTDPEGKSIRSQLLGQAFEQFDELTRTILYLKHGDGLTIQEIAGVTGYSRKTVGKKLKKCDAVIGSHFGDEGC
jgi:RNA polymerase sigma-70 factor, ECF subfamily